ncbi:hypothetical protein [Rhodohalobacter sp. 8-1]|uniref:hypothetical protein n=1 Tax=Rhodohalobacter sp. 8-1 TaxID=3131972 RepID=UPI0030EDF0EA
MASDESPQTFKHSDKETDTFLQNVEKLNVDSSYYLTVLAGENQSAKDSFFKKVKQKFGDQLKVIDLRTVVSTVEEESYKKIDEMIANLGEKKYVWINHGDELDGVYTGFSSSVRRYATPQEKYLIRHITSTEKIYFLSLQDRHTVTNFLRRHTQTLITFDYPESLLGRLKQITLNGSSFSSNRQAVTPSSTDL